MKNGIVFMICLLLFLQTVNCGLVHNVLQKLHNIGNKIIPHEHHLLHHDENCAHDHHDHGDFDSQETV